MEDTVKPICVIYLPKDFHLGNFKDNAPMELMKALNGNFGFAESGGVTYTDFWREYYWFCFYDYEIQTPRFEVFNVKDFNEIKYSEFKDLVLKSIEDISNNKFNRKKWTIA